MTCDREKREIDLTTLSRDELYIGYANLWKILHDCTHKFIVKNLKRQKKASNPLFFSYDVVLAGILGAYI